MERSRRKGELWNGKIYLVEYIASVSVTYIGLQVSDTEALLIMSAVVIHIFSLYSTDIDWLVQ